MYYNKYDVNILKIIFRHQDGTLLNSIFFFWSFIETNILITKLMNYVLAHNSFFTQSSGKWNINKLVKISLCCPQAFRGQWSLTAALVAEKSFHHTGLFVSHWPFTESWEDFSSSFTDFVSSCFFVWPKH